MSLSTLLLPLVLAAPSVQQDASDARGLSVTDLARVQRVVDVDVDDRGRRVVYTLRTVHGDVAARGDDVGYRSHLWLVDLEADTEPVALTHGERGAWSPAIGPEGGTLAFLRAGEDGEGAGSPQLWLLPLEGPGEARQVTDLEDGVSSPRWTADGERILLGTSVELDALEQAPPWGSLRPGRAWTPPDPEASEGEASADAEDAAERPAADPEGDLESVRRWLDQGAAESDPTTIARLAFQGELGLRGPERIGRLVVLDLATEEPRVLDTGFQSAAGAAPAPDGTWAVFASRADPEQHPDESRRSALWRVDLESGAVERLHEQVDASLGSPCFEPDGSGLYFTARATAEPTFANSRLRHLVLDGRRPTGVTSTLATRQDAHARNVVVDRAGQAWLLFGREGREVLYRIDDAGRGGALALLGDLGDDDGRTTGGDVLALDAGGERVVYARSSATDPCRRVTRAVDEEPRVVPRPHAALLDGLTLSQPRMHWVERADGTRVQYWVLPAAGDASGPAPVVLSLHGGPHVMWGAGSHSMWHEWHWLTARGYAVVFSNPRGSDGYGEAHRRGNYRDWGTGPTGDVLACLDDALERYPGELDADRQFLTGGSYAGYLTAWIVGHTDRFRAAVAQRGVYDLVTFFGEGNAWRLVEYSFGGLPWEPEVRGILVRESPFTYVESMRTPLLVMHASNDLRTGVSQSEMLYRALRELGRPVEYVRYPTEGHDLSRSGDPRRRVDRLLRIVEFFERFDPEG